MRRAAWFAGVVGSSVLLFACGGSSTSTGLPGGGGTIAGTVTKGPTSAALVAAYALGNGAMGAKLGEATTDAAGSFSIPIGSYAGPVMIQASGGSYADEATGTTMAMGAGDLLTAAIPSVAAGAATAGIQVTPLTTMAQALAKGMSGGMTPANVDAANAAVGSYFSTGDPLRTAPMNPEVAGSGAAATQPQRNAGMTIAAMSQYAKTLGMTASSGVVTAMASDASDGVMDGKMGGAAVPMGGGMMGGTTMQPTAGTSGLAQAMTAFVGSPMNRSGVTLAEMQALVDRLTTSDGRLGATAGGGATMSGKAFLGAMRGGTVTAYGVSGGAVGAPLATATLGPSGEFSMSLGAWSGPVVLKVGGATYADAATYPASPGP